MRPLVGLGVPGAGFGTYTTDFNRSCGAFLLNFHEAESPTRREL